MRRLAILLVLVTPGVARAADEFEIQVYDAETAAPETSGLELHLNYDVREQLTHFTLEPHIGLLQWLEAGAYFQAALRGDGTFDYGGVKLRLKGRVPRRLARVIGLALNLELSAVPRRYESNRLGMELRPVFDVKWRRLYFSVNPIVSLDLDGPDAGHPQLEPCATLTISIIPAINIGVEYYSAFGPVDAPLDAAHQLHRIFAVGNIQYGRIDINLGAGYGLAAGERWIAKAILGLEL